jgi:hypothetical protein
MHISYRRIRTLSVSAPGTSGKPDLALFLHTDFESVEDLKKIQMRRNNCTDTYAQINMHPGSESISATLFCRTSCLQNFCNDVNLSILE